MAMWFRGKQDADLVCRALRGETAAFGDLVERYLPAVRAQAYARVRTRVDAEDVAQDAFLCAYEKLDTLREPQKFGAWLLGIGRHCAARVYERRQRDAAYAEHVPAETAVEPQIERRELLQLLRCEIEQLDDTTREMVLLHYFAGRTSREIAKAMDTTPAAVRKRLQRARIALSERLLRDAAHEDDPRDSAKRIMGLVATLPTDWKSHTTTAVSGATMAGGISGGMVMKVFGIATLLALIGAGWYVAFESSPAPAAVEPRIVKNIAKEQAQPVIEPTLLAAAAAAPSVAVPPEQAPAPTTWECPVRGLVRNQAGQPVEGASVVVSLKDDPFASENDAILATAYSTTDTDGMFVTSVSREYGHRNVVEMLAQKGTQIAFVPAMFDSAYQDYQWPLLLVETADLRGKVVDADGHPIAGVTIMPLQCHPDGPSRGRMQGSYAKTVTSHDGTFTLKSVWKGTWTMNVEAIGYEPQHLESISTSSADLLVTMQNAKTDSSTPPVHAGGIEGDVVDAATGDGIADVGVVARESENGRGESVTGQDGHFVISQLPPGSYSLTYNWNPSVPPAPVVNPDSSLKDIRVKAQRVSGLRWRIDRRYRVQGVVTTEDGTTVAGAFVSIIAEDLVEGGRTINGSPTVWTDGAGRFTAYLRAATSKLYLQASKPGWASAYVGPLRVDQLGLSDVSLTVEPAASISGKYLNPHTSVIILPSTSTQAAAGQPGPAMAKLRGNRYGNKRGISFRGNGSRVIEWMNIGEPFYIGNLIADEYTFTYWEGNFSESSGPVYTKTITVGPGEALRDVVLQPLSSAVATVAGTARFAGEPLSQAWVHLLSGSNTTSGADGSYACTAVDGGESNLEAQYGMQRDGINELHMLTIPVTLEMNRTVRHDPSFAAGPGIVEGTVMFDDQPIAGIKIRTNIEWDDGSKEFVTATTNAKGEYRLSGLPEGPLAVDVSSEAQKKPMIDDQLDVQVLAIGVTQADFVYQSGTLCVRTSGMRGGETARLVALKGQIEIEAITPELVEELENKAVWIKEFQGDQDFCESLPSGVYTAVVGAYDDEQPDIESTLAGLRWKAVFVEVAAGMETAVYIRLE